MLKLIKCLYKSFTSCNHTSWSFADSVFVTLYILGTYLSTESLELGWTNEGTNSHQLSSISSINTVRSRLRCDRRFSNGCWSPLVRLGMKLYLYSDFVEVTGRSLAVLLWCSHIFSLSFTISSRTTWLWGLWIGDRVGSNALYFRPFNSSPGDGMLVVRGVVL